MSALALALAVGLGLVTVGCQEDDLLKPGDVEVNVLHVAYVSDEDLAENPIELDGDPLEAEWGGPLDPDRPALQVRVSRDDGAGDPGDPAYVSLKAIYTDTYFFLLAQWSDGEPNDRKGALEYIGPDLRTTTGCQDALVSDSSWRVFDPEGDEDRLAFVFEMEEASDDLGTFAEQGCQVACHVGRQPAFGSISNGRLDVWQWLATRSNPPRDLFDRQTENPNFPLHGYPAYLEDYVIDSQVGLAPDPGAPAYRENRAPGHTYPLFVYRERDDLPFTFPDCRNEFEADCLKNNGVNLFYIFRDDVTRPIAPFGACDTINEVTLPLGQEARKWRPWNFFVDEAPELVTGYWYTYARESRADVRGRGLWEEDQRRWTLEIGRRLDTGNPGDDVIFSGQPGEEVPFAVALFDDSGTVHRGSAAQVLRFGPKPASGGSR